jgi:hypothetical protein
MRVKMERQSVSMRDDKKAPNREIIEVMGNCKLKSFIQILSESYCPKVDKNKATWVLWDRHKVVAVFDSINNYCKCFYDENLQLNEILKDEENSEMYLYYRENEDIDNVYDELREELIG